MIVRQSKYVCNSKFGFRYFSDGKSKLEPEDDVAYVLWKRGWHMPDGEQLKEMADNCRWNCTTINNILVFVGESKLNGAEIILPAAGSFVNDSIRRGEENPSVTLWACDLKELSDNSYGVYCRFTESQGIVDYYKGAFCREHGYSVRPVR